MYCSVIANFYRNSSVAIILYAINNINTFNDVGYWIGECKSYCPNYTKLFLVGNKIDINEEE